MNRGDVYRLRPRASAGHEQSGVRYAVIVQTDALQRLSTVIVAPTSTSAAAASFRPSIELRGEQTRVLIDQLTAIDVGRLGRKTGHLPAEELWAVEDALRLVLEI